MPLVTKSGFWLVPPLLNGVHWPLSDVSNDNLMPPPVLPSLSLHRILVAEGHSYFGRHGRLPSDYPMQETSAIECVAGRGLRGDRFFDYKPGYKGQVTLFAQEVLEELSRAFGLPVSPSALRRNLLVSGVNLNHLIGQRFELQGVCLEGTEECRPCSWMDAAVAPGAEAWLRGRGGLRCRILTDGWLRTDA